MNDYIEVFKVNDKTFVVADKVIAINLFDNDVVISLPMGNQLCLDKECESNFLYNFGLVRTDSGIQYRRN